MDEVAEESRKNVFFTGVSGCLPFLGIYYPSASRGSTFKCRELSEQIAQLTKVHKPKAVIVARWSAYTSGFYDGSGLILTSTNPKGLSMFKGDAGFNRTVDYYNSIGVPLIIGKFLINATPQISSTFIIKTLGRT